MVNPPEENPELNPNVESVPPVEPEIVEPEVLDPIQVLTAERDELRDLMLRSRAEFENVRKRMNRERDEERKYAALPVVRDLLPALDNLERAIEAGESSQDADALIQGVQMVLKQIYDALSQSGVKVIDSVGLQFDPNLHEALQQTPSDEFPSMTVIKEYQKGYQIQDRVIRPSKVIVSSGPQE